MQKYLMDDLKAIFVEGERDESFVYGAYFVAPAEAQKVDAVFRSLHFERIEIKDEFEGTPAYAYQSLEREIARVNLEIDDVDKEAGEMLSDRAPQLVRRGTAWKNCPIILTSANSPPAWRTIRKTTTSSAAGWQKTMWKNSWEEVKDDDKVFVVVEDDHDAYFGNRPQSWKTRRYSSLLRCLSKCTAFPRTTRWIRRFSSV